MFYALDRAPNEPKKFIETVNVPDSKIAIIVANATYFSEGVDITGHTGISFVHMLSWSYADDKKASKTSKESTGSGVQGKKAKAKKKGNIDGERESVDNGEDDKVQNYTTSVLANVQQRLRVARLFKFRPGRVSRFLYYVFTGN
jgi:hypothetical protein